MLSLYVSVATRAFRRYSTYTAATLAGIFTNCVFGVIICYVYLALWDEQPHAGRRLHAPPAAGGVQH